MNFHEHINQFTQSSSPLDPSRKAHKNQDLQAQYIFVLDTMPPESCSLQACSFLI